MSVPAFDCRRCGHCCHGVGGIVMTARDRARLAEHLGIGVAELVERFAERVGGKIRLRCGEDGYCVFYREGVGCGVHPGRPDICRAWPFFRGNLVDKTSWEMIQSDCPGVAGAAGHEAFVREGVDYLYANGLVHEPGEETPHALVLPDELKRRDRS